MLRLLVARPLVSRPLGRVLAATAPRWTRNFADAALRKTPLFSLHESLGGQMVPFAGWSLPIKYADKSIVESHLHTRSDASIFDVSHMLQLRLEGADRVPFLETLVCGDIAALGSDGKGTLTLFTTSEGTIIDDAIVTAHPDHLYVVSNAACADKDLAHITEQLALYKQAHPKADVSLSVISDRALIALQGPKASAALQAILADPSYDLAFLSFMSADPAVSLKTGDGAAICHVARSGYTGEDGFEISVPADQAEGVARQLLAQKGVAGAGLGARDTLRLEAGMCLYGNDISDSTSPIEASLLWTVGRRRRVDGGFLGAKAIQDDIALGVTRKRVGLILQGHTAPAREGAEIVSVPKEGEEPKVLGVVTSGCPSPSLGKNIAMGYVAKGHTKSGTPVGIRVRKRILPAVVTKMPFVSSNYFKP